MTKVNKLALFSLLLLWSVASFAQPSVSGTSGTMSHGESVTISGSNFGTGSTIIKQDFFEQSGGDYDDGDPITNGWVMPKSVSYRNDATYETDSPRTGNSTKHIRTFYGDDGGGYEGDSGFAYYTGSNLTGPYYVTFYWKFNKISGSTPNHFKYFRMVNDANYANPITTLVWASSDTYTNIRGDSCGYYDGSDYLNEVLPEDEWLRHEAYYEESSPFDGTENGNVITRMQLSDDSSFGSWIGWQNCWTQCSGQTDHWLYLWFGPYMSCDGQDCNYEHLWDDVVILSSWARVEIGNNSTFADCTHREIQSASAWANDEITVTINAGSFEDLTDGGCYLFVVDEDGNVSGGHQLTGGEGGGTGEPTVSGGGMSGGNW